MEAEDSRVDLWARAPGHAVIHALLSRPGMLRNRGAVARLVGCSPVTDAGKSWYSGALGELEVGRMLRRLGPRWTVLHALPIGGGDTDIDHLIVGQAGVFTVNTKHHPGQRVWVAGHGFLVGGQRQGYIRKSQTEAQRVARLLGNAVGWPVPVQAVVAVLGSASFTVKAPPIGVHVIKAGALVRWLKRRPPVLTGQQLEAVLGVVGTATTWRAHPDDDADLNRHPQFDRLHREYGRARRRRLLLATIPVVGVLLAGWAYLPGVFGR
ncbi:MULTISPECIES: nuclease-related domain-containing protein [Kribbella]|uniref:NERD domain-containing protein n=1 Tax=Kribbella karoonensis TaxID=324851 RepID=A0ABN2DNT5_9ACTN